MSSNRHANPNISPRAFSDSLLAVLPDGRFASGSEDTTICLWDLATGSIRRFEGYTDCISCLAVLPDGRLALGCDDETIRIHDLATGNEELLKGHTGTITCLAVLPDGRLASGSWDETFRIWDLITGSSEVFEVPPAIYDDSVCGYSVGTIEVEQFALHLVALPDCSLAFLASMDDAVIVYNIATGNRKELPGRYACLAALPDGRLALGDDDGTICVYDSTTGEREFLEGHVGGISCLALQRNMSI